MKHFNQLTAILVMIASLLNSCSVDSTLPDATKASSEYYVVASEPEFSSEYDKQISLFTKTVRNAIANNESFRDLIKKQSSLMLTGDFDVLMNTISDTQVEVSDENILTKGASSSMTVNDLLRSYLPEDVKTKSTGNNIIEDLQSQYPDLQISVPVHAEEWNPATYTPVVAFRPEDYQDSTVTVIPGYDAEGNFVWVDAVNVPDKPVIVVGESERALNEIIVFPGDSVTIIDKPLKPMQPSNQPPKAPTNLTFNVTSNSIILSWEHDSDASGYVIYRKGSGENEFTNIGNSEDYRNRTFEDKYLKSNATYAYYVTAFNYINVEFDNGLQSSMRLQSEMSNIVVVKAPEVLEPLSYFEAVTSGEQVELRWNNDGHIDNDVIIEYKVPGMGVTEYYNLLETTGAYNNYIYNSPFKGTQVDYRAYRSNGIGVSDAVYDYIYPPYRNTADYSPVYVKSISYTDERIERWPAGRPEFYLKVVGTDKDGKTVELQDQVEFVFGGLAEKRDKIEYFENRLVYNWMPTNAHNWYSALTFYLEEYDKGDNIKFTAQAQLNIKLAKVLNAQLSTGITVDFSDKGEDCGRAYINYFDNPEIELLFPNYGAKIRLSEKP